jgi:hypothetical protein
MGILAKNDIKFCEDFSNFYIKCKEKNQIDINEEKKFKTALQAFVMEPVQAYKNRVKLLKKKIQAVGVSTDFEILTKDSFNITIESDNFDMGYEKAFRQVVLGERQDSWEIYNVANSLTFVKVEEGQRIEVAGLSGTNVLASVDYYGGAIGWTDKMIRYRKVPAMIEMAEVFRNKFWSNKADNHYALLAAAAALNVTPYAGAAADGQLQRDIQTINLAAFTLTDRLKDKGFGDMANAPLIMYANPRDKDRIGAAFRVTTASLATAGRTGDMIGYNIDVIYTFNSNITAGSPILVLPGKKIQKADGMQPTVFNQEQDILTLNRVQAVWAIYGAIVSDTDQAEQLSLS